MKGRARALSIVIVAAVVATAAVGARPANFAGAGERTPSPVSLADFSPSQITAPRPCDASPSIRRYVSPLGSDRGPGTMRRPWRTISRAVGSIVPGEAVYVRTGTYPEWVDVTRNGTESAPVSLRAFPGEHPVLTGRLKIEGDYVCAAGLRFLGRTPANSGDVLIYVSGAQHVELLRNDIRNAAKSGIYVGDEGALAGDLSIVGNVITKNGTHSKFDHGIYLGHVDGGLVANNLVFGNLAQGIKIEPEASGVIATDNTIVANGTSGVIVGGEEDWSSNSNLVVNNIIAFNAGYGIRTYWEQSTGGGNLAVRNLIFGNSQGKSWFPGGGLVEQESVVADPKFVPGGFRPSPLSGALQQAVPAYSMPIDFYGRARPKEHADLGAIER